MQIKRTLSFIEEIGRITDHVNRSIEADMVSILQRTFMPEQVNAATATNTP